MTPNQLNTLLQLKEGHALVDSQAARDLQDQGLAVVLRDGIPGVPDVARAALSDIGQLTAAYWVIRDERRVERFSRGAELIRTIRTMWRANNGADHDVIEARIQGLMEEFDLTLPEWHYWATHSRMES